MSFVISKVLLKSGKIAIVYDKDALSGVKKIASKLSSDIKAVFGYEPEVSENHKNHKNNQDYQVRIFVGTDSSSEGIENKRECFKLEVKDNDLYITGSDKRGTIYGMFKLSELLGVSPFIDWLDAKPDGRSEFTLKDNYIFISKEPSVKYRGFFINDEWPAFGNFCNKNYGGFNSKVYEHIFELLLRLKGNYMWPAMWSAVFTEDGPSQANEELADELGVIMGMSHHEPCLRQGEEYKHLRGKDSIYGDAWNFRTNKKGITRFWEDGLRRSGKYENVITVGMRGEADTKIMENATLKDNIDLLRDVLKTQNSLIKKYVNKDLDKVPRMLALYKEVEPYFYGDATTEGLMGDKELEGVTLMLCDDNYGNLRTLPTPTMRSHKGGYGMYYHFDYHGLPVSFEWVNTTHISKVWEQMTTAFDFGVRELWIVNVGDVFGNEYPLNYFMELAYDFDKWGTSNINSASEFNEYLSVREFNNKRVSRLLSGYTKITSRRRTEAMNSDVYAPFAYGECEALIDEIEELQKMTISEYKKLDKNKAFTFYELVYYPLMANLNVIKMWLYATLNHGYASFGSTYSLSFKEKIDECIKFDRELVSELHKTHNHKWYGMGLSEHIGFKYWCEEECQYPVVHTFEASNKNRIIANIPGTNQHTEGRCWTGRVMTLGAFLKPDVLSCDRAIALTTAGREASSFTVEVIGEGITVKPMSGQVKYKSIKYLKVDIDKAQAFGKVGKIIVHSGDSNIEIRVPVTSRKEFRYDELENAFLRCSEWSVDLGKTITGTPSFTKVLEEGTRINKFIAMEAEHYYEASPEFKVIPDYGRSLSGIKAYPQDKFYKLGSKAPRVTYRFEASAEGKYVVELYTNPSNPCTNDGILEAGYSINDGKAKRVSLIAPGFKVEDGNMPWQTGVLENVRKTRFTVDLIDGVNYLNLYALTPGFVLERIVIYKEGFEPVASYLGPTESYRVKGK